MEVGQGPNWGFSAKQKKDPYIILIPTLIPQIMPPFYIFRLKCFMPVGPMYPTSSPLISSL
jgi:hypothetical protein